MVPLVTLTNVHPENTLDETINRMNITIFFIIFLSLSQRCGGVIETELLSLLSNRFISHAASAL